MSSWMPKDCASSRYVLCAPTPLTSYTQHDGSKLNATPWLGSTKPFCYSMSRTRPNLQTINHRLGVLRCLYRFHYGREIPGKPSFLRTYTTRLPFAYGPL